MFSLIITVISVALVAALAIATAYYGGDVYETRKSQSEANRYINETQQIVGAINLWRAEGNGPLEGGVQALVDEEYLDSAPDAAEFYNFQTGALSRAVGNAATCKQVNITAGLPDSYITDTPQACGTFEEDLTSDDLSPQYYCCDDS